MGMIWQVRFTVWAVLAGLLSVLFLIVQGWLPQGWLGDELVIVCPFISVVLTLLIDQYFSDTSWYGKRRTKREKEEGERRMPQMLADAEKLLNENMEKGKTYTELQMRKILFDRADLIPRLYLEKVIRNLLERGCLVRKFTSYSLKDKENE